MENQRSLKDRTSEMVNGNLDVKRWMNNLNSDSSKRIYSESLLKFSEFTKLTPAQIVQKFKENQKEGEDLVTNFIFDLKGKRTPKSVGNHLNGVKSWLRHNEIDLKRKINCGNLRETPTLENECAPDQNELNRILKYSDLRGKSAIALIAFAGLRPTASINLKLMDLPDLKNSIEEVKFNKTPAQVRVRSRYSKNSKAYFTFLSSEGCEYLTEYLKYRMKLGEKLTPESPVLSYSQKSKLKSFTRKGYSKLIKRVFERAGYNARPYVLRAYFDTAIMNSRGINHDIQQFIMGHSGSIEAIYTVNKKLPEWQVEKMREQFRENIEPNLQTINVIVKNKIDGLESENKRLRMEIEQMKLTQNDVVSFITQLKKANQK